MSTQSDVERGEQLTTANTDTLQQLQVAYNVVAWRHDTLAQVEHDLLVTRMRLAKLAAEWPDGDEQLTSIRDQLNSVLATLLIVQDTASVSRDVAQAALLDHQGENQHTQAA